MNTFATRSSSCCVAGTSSRKITREQVTTLRNINIGKKSWAHKLQKFIHNLCSEITTLMGTPMKSVQPTKNMCKYYGHVIQGAWKGYLPKCADCGCEISSPDQLRKASPTR